MSEFQEVLNRASMWQERHDNLREENTELKRTLRKAEARIDKLLNKLIKETP